MSSTFRKQFSAISENKLEPPKRRWQTFQSWVMMGLLVMFSLGNVLPTISFAEAEKKEADKKYAKVECEDGSAEAEGENFAVAFCFFGTPVAIGFKPAANNNQKLHCSITCKNTDDSCFANGNSPSCYCDQNDKAICNQNDINVAHLPINTESLSHHSGNVLIAPDSGGKDVKFLPIPSVFVEENQTIFISSPDAIRVGEIDGEKNVIHPDEDKEGKPSIEINNDGTLTFTNSRGEKQILYIGDVRIVPKRNPERDDENDDDNDAEDAE